MPFTFRIVWKWMTFQRKFCAYLSSASRKDVHPSADVKIPKYSEKIIFKKFKKKFWFLLFTRLHCSSVYEQMSTFDQCMCIYSIYRISLKLKIRDIFCCRPFLSFPWSIIISIFLFPSCFVLFCSGLVVVSFYRKIIRYTYLIRDENATTMYEATSCVGFYRLTPCQ